MLSPLLHQEMILKRLCPGCSGTVKTRMLFTRYDDFYDLGMFLFFCSVAFSLLSFAVGHVS